MTSLYRTPIFHEKSSYPHPQPALRHWAVALLGALILTGPVAAQEDNGLNLMEEGARLFLRGLMSEMEPALDELEGIAREFEPMMRDFALHMGPAFQDLIDDVQDWSLYHPPEILPNGDIILRRKSPLSPPTDAPPAEEIEL